MCILLSFHKTHKTKSRFSITAASDRVALIVGKEEVKIMCHKTLLGYYSEFFEASLYGDFKGAHTGEVILPEESPDVVGAFISWLYTGCIIWDGEAVERQFDEPYSEGIPPAVGLWVLGDKFLSPQFTNAVMDSIIAHFADNGVLEAKTAEFAYENTIDGSKLRRFIKDLIETEGPISPTNCGRVGII